MIYDGETLRKALENARIAYHQGNHAATRYWAREAIKLNPNIEEPWLWLAAVGSPRASVEYLQQALKINPNSQRARQGMHWAVKRVRSESNLQPAAQLSSSAISYPASAKGMTKASRQLRVSPYIWIGIVILLAVISTPLASPALGFYINSLFSKPEPLIMAQVGISKASNTPTPTNTPTHTPTPTPTITPSPTPTETPTPSPTATSTPTVTPTDTPTPTETEYPTEEYDELPLPGGDDRWIDVDLSDQMVYAYEGEIIVNQFLVSTGTWAHPTVTGQFHIYVKYLYTDMAGPGYYLPDVPYTMYFYDGYGLHGTYWHSNFGTPMSHGCINLSIPDSKWLYFFADVGTLVNIHD